MKKIIFKNFLRETTEFFVLSSCAVTIIVWVIQAVNYLEFVTEDGHSFKIYFLYTIYSLPKIFNKLMPFMFFFSIFFTLIKYEEQNQTLIFFDDKGSVLNFDQESKLLWKTNVYKKKDQKLKPILYCIVPFSVKRCTLLGTPVKSPRSEL